REFSRALAHVSKIRRTVVNLSLLSSVVLGGAGLLLYALAAPLLVLLYGEEYRSGAQYLQVLSWILPIQGLRAISREIVYAWRRQRADTRNLAFAAGANVAFDIILIPTYGALGCAVSTLIAEVVFLFGSWQSAYVACQTRSLTW